MTGPAGQGGGTDRLRVLERGSSVATAYCGRLLGSVGADVLKVEPPDGDRQRRLAPLVRAPDGQSVSALFEYLNCYKSSVVLDERNPHDRARLDELVGWSDIVLDYGDAEPERVQEDYRRARVLNPRVVYVALSGFGLTGPYRHYRSNDFLDLAAGGQLYITGDPDREPVRSGGPTGGYAAGATAAYAALAAAAVTDVDGRGQLVDVGAMEALAGLHQWTLTLYSHQGYVKRRVGNRYAESYHPIGLFQCRDGWISLAVSGPAAWEAFCLALDLPELLVDERFETGGDRFDHADELDALIEPRLSALSTGDAVAMLQANRVPVAPVFGMLDVLADRQLQARDFWAPYPRLGDGARVPARAFRLPDDPPFRAAPALGDATARVRTELGRVPTRRSGAPRAPGAMPLSGVRVLEFSIAWAGPLAGRTLADLGAEVIRVERPDSRGTGWEGIGGDRIERDIAGWRWGELPGPVFRSGVYPDADPRPRPWNRQGILNKLNRNKRSLCIELKQAGGREVLRDLVEVSDIVLNNYSPRGAVSLGIDHDALSRDNPHIITVAMSGYGHCGPDAMRVSLGPILEAHSGLVSVTGYPDRGPLKMGVAFPDPIGSLHAVVAVLSALRRRARDGQGVSVDLSQFESYASIVGEHYLASSVAGVEPPRPGNRSPDAAPQGVYRCAGNDEWLALSVESDQEWVALARVVGPTAGSDRYTTLAGRQSDHDEIDRAIEAWTIGRDKLAAMAELQSAGVRAVALMNSRDLVEGDHLNARGFVAEWDQPDVGLRRFPGFSVHFERPATIPMHGAPTLGADNEFVLGEVLGYPEDKIEALRRTGVIATAPPAVS